jgi:hypothetical protein
MPLSQGNYIPANFLSQPHAKSVIYAIRCHDYVKVGLSDNLEQRLHSFELGNPYDLEVLIYRSVPRWYRKEFETMVHQALDAHAHRREWFKVSPEIAIATVKTVYREAQKEIRKCQRNWRLIIHGERQRWLEQVARDEAERTSGVPVLSPIPLT